MALAIAVPAILVLLLRRRTRLSEARHRALLLATAARALDQQRRLQDDREAEALHDPLTGLPNRTLFLDRLEHALARARRPPARLAVLFCDIDGFKAVNDRLGHEAGDRVLTAVSSRLCGALRPADTVARLGGDEFVVLCEDLDAEADAVHIAERLVAALTSPVAQGGREYPLSASVGLAFAEGPSETGAAELLREADAAMYRAKERGGGRFDVYDKPMRQRFAERVRIEDELSRGISESELELLYQPVVSLATGEIVAAEALVRWDHPERGLLAPAEFIGVADESGLIIPLGEWVIGAVCRQGVELAGDVPSPPTLAINLSAQELALSPIADTLGRALMETGLHPRLIELDVTESALGDQGASMATLLRLKGMGVRLILDDFGSGRSSLRDLQQAPIDALKIDRAFVAGLEGGGGQAALVEALLAVADTLGIEAILEGVETPAQLAWLREHGCRLVQGYLLSPPVPPDALVELIEREPGAILEGAAAA